VTTEKTHDGMAVEPYSPKTDRGRRRATTWFAFGLMGLMLGVTWAAGVTTSSATINTEGATAAATVFGTASTGAGTSAYDGLITADTGLQIDLVGHWGVIAADTPIFNVDLSGQTGTFFAEVYLTNAPSGWSVLQIEFRQVDKACADALPADWAAPAATSVMVLETVDAFASFTGLTGGSSACIGVQGIAKANDAKGTFMRIANGWTPTAPEFAAIINRSS
jgi:hypothetical protein